MQSLSIRFLIGLSKASDPPDPGPYALERTVIDYDGRAADALAILSAAYSCLGSWRGVGYWQGKAEPSLTVETVVEVPDLGFDLVASEREAVVGRAQSLAREVARALGQEAVGLVVAPVRFTLEGPHAAL